MYNDNFDSLDNKRLLWQLLYENNVFNNISDNRLNNIQNIFEQQINYINSNNSSLNLIEKNKKLIKLMIEQIEIFKNYKTLKPLEEVEIKLTKDFEDKKEEMINLLKKPNNKEIDFNKGIDNPINNEEMDNILSEMIKQRNMDIETTEPIKNKKVNFEIKETDNINFLSKLKKQNNQEINNQEINNNNNIIINKLDKILKNQEEILSYLKYN